jgi:hypothetical protein
VSHARLAVVEPALFERDVFEMTAPTQSSAKCKMHSVIRFLNTKAEIHKQIVAVYGIMNRQNVTKWCREFSKGRIDVHDKQRSCWPSLISDNLLQKTEGEIMQIGSG